MLNRLEMMRIFCAAAESGSFKEAASRLGISPQSVTRAVKELETRVGEPLFYRNTRQIRITDFGEQLARRARESLRDINELFARSDKESDSEMYGVVRITAPTTIGRRFLPAILSRIAATHPHISFELKLSETIFDVVEQQIDIGIRVGFLRDSSFVARAMSKISFLAVGTPQLIARVGRPKHIFDLLDMPTVALVDANTGKRWPWYFQDGQQFKPRVVPFVTNDAESELSLVLESAGFGQLADSIALPYIRSGRLVQVLQQYAPPPWDLYVYRPQRGPVPARIRVVYDQILEAFANPQLLNQA